MIKHQKSLKDFCGLKIQRIFKLIVLRKINKQNFQEINMTQKPLIPKKEYEFIGKALYLPKLNILAIGDLHLGYEFMLRESGSLIPPFQEKQTKQDLEEIFEILNKQKKQIKKVIFLGDIKHFFAYQKAEKNILVELLKLVEKYVDEENIILIKGNHEKIAQIANRNFVSYYIEDNMAFVHGDIVFPEIFKNKGIKLIIMGHLHPAITLRDEQKIKSEKYKCFLSGNYESKQFIILPSFLPIIEGTSINEFLRDGSCIIPKKNLLSFNVHIIGEKNVYPFGKLKDLTKID